MTKTPANQEEPYITRGNQQQANKKYDETRQQRCLAKYHCALLRHVTVSYQATIFT
jgi:hypothetical protein